MLATRLLLVVGGGASFTAPPLTPPSVVSITAAPNGGWTQIQDPKAFYHNGATYISYLDGLGNIEIAKYVHSTGVVTTATVKAAFEVDNHASPCVIVRSSDDRIVVAAAQHSGSTPYIWISQNAEDITGTWTEVTPDASIGGEQYTYMTLYQMASGEIYLFYRDFVVSTSTGRLGFSSSTDGGETWASRLILYTGASGEVPYWRIMSDGDHRIDVFVTDVEPDASALGHFYYDTTGNTVHASDGTALTWNGTSTLLDWSDITQVHAATCWSWGASTSVLGPATVIMEDTGGDNRIKTARWRSGAWQVDTVVESVGGQLAGNQYGSGAGIHHTDPDIVYVARKSIRWEMWRYTSADDGATWTGTQLTSGSSVDHIWADVVHHAAGLEGIWLSGDYTSDTDFDFGISGAIP